MRRPPNQKTSPRTLALPGFVVSGLSKMQGLMGSVVSFERVQMSPYQRSPLFSLRSGLFEDCHSNVEDALAPRSFDPSQRLEAEPRYAPDLNAFKRPLPGSMPIPSMHPKSRSAELAGLAP